MSEPSVYETLNSAIENRCSGAGAVTRAGPRSEPGPGADLPKLAGLRGG
jgi:hypothetical protein